MQVYGSVLHPRFVAEAVVFLAVACLCAHVARVVIQRRADELAEQCRDDEHDETGERDHARKLADRQAGCAHDDDLAVRGQRAQTEQGTDQRGDRQHLEREVRQPEHGIKDSLRRLVVGLHVLEFRNELEQSCEREQNHEHERRAREYRAHQVLAQYARHRNSRR